MQIDYGGWLTEDLKSLYKDIFGNIEKISFLDKINS